MSVLQEELLRQRQRLESQLLLQQGRGKAQAKDIEALYDVRPRSGTAAS